MAAPGSQAGAAHPCTKPGQRARTTLWTALDGVLGAALSLGSAVLLAAMLGPEDVGTGAVALAVLMIVNLPLNRLFPDALVQVPALPPGAASCAGWIVLGLGLAVGGTLALAAPGLGEALGHPEAAPAIAWLAATCPAAGLGGVAQGLLLRAGATRSIALVGLGCQGMATAVAVLAAALGAGPLALAIQYGLGVALPALVHLIRGAVPLRVRPSLRPAVGLLRIGLPAMAAQLLHQGRGRLFLLLAASRLDPASMGALHLGFRLVDAGRDVAAGIVGRSLLPPLARAQAEPARFRAAFDRASLLVGLLVLPPFAGLALTAPVSVEVLLGQPWAKAAPVVALNAALAVVVLARAPASVALTAMGRTGSVLAIQLGLFAITLVLALPVPFSTPGGAALVWLLAGLAGAPLGIGIAARRLGLGARAQFTPLLPGFASILVLCACVVASRRLGLPEPGAPWILLLREAAAGALGACLVAAAALLVLGCRPPPLQEGALHAVTRA